MATPENILQIYTANPITSNASTDLMYFGQSPYGITNDAAMTYANFAAQFISKDANGNISANNFLSGYATTATSATTTTLTVASKYQQYFTGATTQTVVLPVTSTLVLGQSFYIVNNSSGAVTVESSGGNTIKAMAANTALLVTCILTSGTTAASWNEEYAFQSPNNGSGTVTSVTFTGDGTVFSNTPSSPVTTTGTLTAALNTQAKNLVFAGPTTGSAADPTFRSLVQADLPTTLPSITKINVQTFTSGTSTYTPTPGMVYCAVEIVGGGGGGGGAASAAGNSGQGSGGGGGGYCLKTYTATLLGSTADVVVGAIANGGSAGNHAGTAGNGSSFTPTGGGETLTAGGGGAGNGMPETTTTNSVQGAVGGSASGGDVNIPGGAGEGGVVVNGAAGVNAGGGGGGSYFAPFQANLLTGSTQNATGFGGGGGGAAANSAANLAGGNSTAGYCIVTEYISI